MFQKSTIIPILFSLVLLGISACTPATKLTASWTQGGEPAKYENLSVVALTKVPSNRSIVERALALELQRQGIGAYGTLDVFPFADKQDELEEMGIDMGRENIERIVREKVERFDIDALAIVTLLDKKQEEEARGGNFGVSMGYPVSTYPYYSYSPYGYYSYAYSTIYSPTYYVTTTTYMVETNIYDVETEALIWSGRTETTDPKTVTTEAANWAKIVVDQIILDGALKGKPAE